MAPAIYRIWFIFWNAISLNARMFAAKLRGRTVVTLHISAASQMMHIEPLISELSTRTDRLQLSLFLLTSRDEMPAVRTRVGLLAPNVVVGLQNVARLLLSCDFLLSVDQGMIYPYVGCKVRACFFHGQPSKGNVYQRFNFHQINHLFFYGPLMRDHYLESKKNAPHWPTIEYHEVGQPLADSYFNRRRDKAVARMQLGLTEPLLTVIYAPSFEYCSSLATDGPSIIEALLSLRINLIVKPHPAFFNASAFRDEFNQNIPNIHDWYDRAQLYNCDPNCLFAADNRLDMPLALSAADIMLTDFSGIAFDGILGDLGMIYWDCPLLYSDYLPARYGIDGDKARTDLACNVGREAGIVVHNLGELIAAVESYRNDPALKSSDRELVREQLLFNPGSATTTFVNKVEEIIRSELK